jgi:hypothetical protein
MTDASRSTQFSPGQLRDLAIAALVPFFLDDRAGDPATAWVGGRVMAEGLLDEYRAVTPEELQLSAQIIAFGWAALTCISASIVVKDRSPEDMLRLQGHAIALDRLSQKATKALEARRRDRGKNRAAMPPGSAHWDQAAFQLAINNATQKMSEANDKLRAFAAAAQPASRPAPKPSPLLSEPMTSAVLTRRRRA